MNIILNENEWASEKIEQIDLGDKPGDTLRRIARMYMDEGISKNNIPEILEKFILSCDPAASIPKWEATINRAIKFAEAHPSINIGYIDIYESELAIIKSIKKVQVKRLAFTLLCLSKYWDIFQENNNGWVYTKDSEIMKMANINTSIKRQSDMYRQLEERGLIHFPEKVNSTSMQVMFSKKSNLESESVALRVSDFRNLGYQILKYYGGPYYECENCGIISKTKNPKRGRKPKYCPNCAVEIKLKQSVESVMRYRSRQQRAFG